MLTWSVITDKIQAEADTARQEQMIDQMPVNVMFLDPTDFKITYMNETSRQTLQPLLSLLPCPIDNIVGSTVDIFHKNPAHQRGILSDPSNLPHSAKIKLGDETLDLRVNAISDKQGGYIGAMLSWSVVVGASQDGRQLRGQYQGRRPDRVFGVDRDGIDGRFHGFDGRENQHPGDNGRRRGGGVVQFHRRDHTPGNALGDHCRRGGGRG